MTYESLLLLLCLDTVDVVCGNETRQACNLEEKWNLKQRK